MTSILKKQKPLLTSEQGHVLINEENLRSICLKQGLYQFPQMNHKLYLNMKSISKIQNLQPYINLKSLYLQNNLISKIQNIQCLQNLQCLFLQNNLIIEINNLNCQKLKILNLSGNKIQTLKGLDHLKQLQSLTLNHNMLKTFQSLQHLGACSQTLTNIDLSDNQIELDERIIGLFVHLKCLYLINNPIVRQMKFYRRRLVAQLPLLLYLDQKCVDQQQRIKSKAWLLEGNEGYKRVEKQLEQERLKQKALRSKQLLKDIDVHRQKKINLFLSGIEDCKNEMKKYVKMSSTTNMKDFYNNKIQQEQQKINTYYDTIISIQRKMGKQVLTEIQKIEIPQALQYNGPGNPLINLQQLVPPLEQSTDGSSQPLIPSSQQGSQHSQPQNMINYDELD